MKYYNVYISTQANLDLIDLTSYIAYELKSPITSKRYAKGIMLTIKKLKNSPESFAISTRSSVLKYGYNARRVNFKSHAIIYIVKGNNVFIEAILLQANIKGL